MAQKISGLESIVKSEFSRLSFYSSDNDKLKITKNSDGNINIEYCAVDSNIRWYTLSYFICDISIDRVEKAAVWNYVWLNDEYRKKGWGREMIAKGESLFSMLGMKTAYVYNNINPGFWARVGYPASIKVLDNKGKKNIYAYAYECTGTMSFYKGTELEISSNGNREYTIGYSHPFEKGLWQPVKEFELSISLDKKWAIWHKVDAESEFRTEIIKKFDAKLISLGITDISSEDLRYGPNDDWQQCCYEQEGKRFLRVSDKSIY